MKKFAITICATLLLAGCTSNDSLLSKKQECFGYKTSIEESKNSNYSGTDLATSTTVAKVFYSPKQDSCLYVLETSSLHTNKPGANGSSDIFGLYDYLTGEEIYSIEGCDGELHCGLSGKEAENNFKDELKKYE